MNELNYKEMAHHAIHWASGSWGQGQYDKPKYPDKEMGYLWAEVARIAKENSDNHLDLAIAKMEGIQK